MLCHSLFNIDSRLVSKIRVLNSFFVNSDIVKALAYVHGRCYLSRVSDLLLKDVNLISRHPHRLMLAYFTSEGLSQCMHQFGRATETLV